MTDELSKDEMDKLLQMRGTHDQAIPALSGTLNDNWMHRSKGMRCGTCMWFVPKNTDQPTVSPRGCVGRCRRHAPTMSGWPVMYFNDWCGDHKLDENKE